MIRQLDLFNADGAGGAATLLAAAWKFLRIGGPRPEGPLDSLYALGRRIRKADTEAELLDIEEEIDDILKAERAKSPAGEERGGCRDIE
jgi:hypothetical protein